MATHSDGKTSQDHESPAQAVAKSKAKLPFFSRRAPREKSTADQSTEAKKSPSEDVPAVSFLSLFRCVIELLRSDVYFDQLLSLDSRPNSS